MKKIKKSFEGQTTENNIEAGSKHTVFRRLTPTEGKYYLSDISQ